MMASSDLRKERNRSTIKPEKNSYDLNHVLDLCCFILVYLRAAMGQSMKKYARVFSYGQGQLYQKMILIVL